MTWRTQPALTALSTSARAASNCSWVMVAGSDPRPERREPDRVAHLVEIGHLAGELVAEQDVERVVVAGLLLVEHRGRSCPTATAPRGWCPGRTSGRGRCGSRLAGKFGMLAASSVSSQPRRTSRSIIQSVTTMRSHSVGRPASSGPDRLRREEVLVAVDRLDVVDLDPGLLGELRDRRVRLVVLVDVDVADPVREPEGAGRPGAGRRWARLAAARWPDAASAMGRATAAAGSRRERRAARRDGLTPLPAVEARNAPNPTAADGDARRRRRNFRREMPRRRRRRARRQSPAAARGAATGHVRRRLAAGLDGEGVVGRPDQPDLLARLPQLGAGRALDVLLVDGDRAAAPVSTM